MVCPSHQSTKEVTETCMARSAVVAQPSSALTAPGIMDSQITLCGLFRVEVNLGANFDADHFRAPFLAVANDVRASEKSKVAQLTDRKFLHAPAFISG